MVNLLQNQASTAQKGSRWGSTPTLWLAYGLLAVLLTWPTVTHLTTHLPGDGADDPAIAWNLWWVKHSLLVEGQNPFQSNYMFYPLGVNLAFYTLTVLNAVTALPIILNWGVVTASNLHLIFTFVAGGYGVFLLTRYTITTFDNRLTQTHPKLIWFSAAVAGCFYTFSSSKLFYISLGQFNIGSSHWIPFAVLYVLRTDYHPHRLKNALLAGLFLILQTWAEMTYASFLLIFIGLNWLYQLTNYTFRLIRQEKMPHRTSTKAPVSKGASASPEAALPRSSAPRLHLYSALIMILTFSLGLSPILAQMLPDMLIEGDFFVVGGGFAQDFSADLLGFIVPTIRHPWLGQLIHQTGIAGYNLGQHIYIGFVLLGLILINLRSIFRQPALRFWLVAAFIFALLTLGPVILINGYMTNVGGPFTILQQIPFFKGNRYPSRYSVMVMLCLSVLAGFSLIQLSRWAERLKPSGPTIVLSLATLFFLFEHLPLPLPQSDMRPPAAYQIIADDPDEFVVLDIPFAWRNGFRVTGALTTEFMFGQFYQTYHQKRHLQGNTSRNPEFKFQYFTNAPILNSLLALQTGQSLPAERWAADRTIAAEALRFFDIKYIVVRPDPTGNPEVTPQATMPYIETVFPVEKIRDAAEITIYQVRHANGASHVSERFHIDTENPLAPLYFGEGWGWLSPGQPITAQRKKARLFLPLTGDKQRITFRLRLPDTYMAAPQKVRLVINGWSPAWQSISETWTDYTFEVPAGVASPGLNDVWLYFDQITTLPQIQPGATALDVTALSAGKLVGDFGHIFINGYEVSPNERGYNIARLEPDRALTIANFDTHFDSAASDALTYFILSASTDTLIAAAAADEASNNLSEAAVQTLQSFGATGDLRGCFRCSHAFIGKNASGGNPTEALDALRPVGVTTGLGLTEPRLAAVVEWIRVEAVGE